MKAAEINVGEEVAITSGTAHSSQHTDRATKARVEGLPLKGRVRVTLLENARYGFGRRPAGEEIRIPTRHLWMPWETLERRAGNELAQREQRQQEEKAREDRLAELQRRVDQFAGEVDEALAWDGLRHRGVTKFVRVPTPALEALLDRAER